ncbi:MAG: hypothetical protein WD100_07680 [Tistlia sp.]|uniref:hypothetical protein n=1 Tax=Tistlia sp. TaxID=3057121 RepID=UPI0034A39B43
MYRIGTPGYDKSDQAKRWALPDRVFFACGACHILAFAFMERYGGSGARALWLRPARGHASNHIFVATADWTFDYHGYAERRRYLDHTFDKARRWWPGWDATFVELPTEVLISEPKSRQYDGLRLREPSQFLRDPLSRARAFLDRFPPPPGR